MMENTHDGELEKKFCIILISTTLEQREKYPCLGQLGIEKDRLGHRIIWPIRINH